MYQEALGDFLSVLTLTEGYEVSITTAVTAIIAGEESKISRGQGICPTSRNH